MAGEARRGGRPSREQAGQIEDRILQCAAELFLEQGYSATSIEAIVCKAAISKRTFYHRFDDKKAVFGAVVERLMGRLRPPDEQHLFEGESLAVILHKLAKVIAQAAVSTDAIRLHRLLLSEASRVPEMAGILQTFSMRNEAVARIAALLKAESLKGHIRVANPGFAAEQFLHMVMAAPQRRAMGMGKAMSSRELDHWALLTVDLFLYGCKANA